MQEDLLSTIHIYFILELYYISGNRVTCILLLAQKLPTFLTSSFSYLTELKIPLIHNPNFSSPQRCEELQFLQLSSHSGDTNKHLNIAYHIYLSPWKLNKKKILMNSHVKVLNSPLCKLSASSGSKDKNY